MTDTATFYRTVVSQVTQFINAYENLQLVAERIGADSALSTASATAAQSGGRSDLSAADFDNLNVALGLMQTLLNANNGGNVPVTINTGGKVKLAFYKLL